MSDTLINLGISGLNAATWGINTTGQNISNSATPGYSVESPVYEETSGQYTSSGYLPAGVTTVTVQRQYSQYLSNQLNSAQTQSGALSTYYSLVSQLNNDIGSPTGGVASAITSYFTGLQSVANDPADPATGQAAIGNAQTLADQITSIGQQYDQLRQSVNTQLTGTVSQINSYTAQIAQLNGQIAATAGQGQPPNQLLDQLDLAVSNLSQLVGVQVQQTASGGSNVTLSNGQPLVVANQSYPLAAVASPSNPSELTIASQGIAGANPPGQTTYLQPATLSGGTLGGLLSFVSQTLDPSEAQLGAIATSFAAQVNAQNALGITQSGTSGGALFSVGSPTVYANQANTGSAALTVSFANAASPTQSNYTLSYNGNQYTLTDSTSGSVVGTSTSMPSTIGGLDFSMTGTMAAGDSFTVQPTLGALDNFSLTTTSGSAIASAAPVLASAASANSGTGAITQGTVSAGYQLPSGTTTLTYDAATQSLSGFPVGTTVTTAGTPPTSIDITSATTAVPYSAAQGAALTISSTTQPPPTGVMNGVSVTLSGTPADGDQFTIAANSSVGSDSRNVLALAALANAQTLGNGTQTLTTAYAGYVNAIGNTANQLNASSTAQTAIVNQVTAAQQSVSGVNLNEEAANLLQYQQLYQANAKVIQTASTLFQSVLSLFS